MLEVEAVWNELTAVFAGASVAAVCATVGATHATTGTRRGGMETHMAQPAAGCDSRSAQLVLRARAGLGGAAAVDAVRSLVLVRNDRTTIKILLPDRLQTITETPWGDAINTLDGNHAWSRQPRLPAHLAGMSPPIAASSIESIRAARRSELAGYTLKYLVRLPTDRTARCSFAGEVAYGHVRGQAVEFSADDGFAASVVFDSDGGLPIAYVRAIKGDAKTHGTHLIEELQDYRRAAKILVPFRVATFRLREGAVEPLAVWRYTVEVDPPLTATDFREPMESGF